MRKFLISVLSALLMVLPLNVTAVDVTQEQVKGLDEQVQDIKKDVIDLAADLLQLEEKLLYPSNSQFAVFVSLAETEGLRLDAVQIKLENKVLAHHLYTFRELEALQKGGVQKIYIGNIKTGEHQLVVSYVAQNSSGSDIRRSSTYSVNKSVGPKFVEIKIGGTEAGDEGMVFKDW